MLIFFIFLISPPKNVKAFDTPNDGGGSITIKWELSPDDSILSKYKIFRKKLGEEYEEVGVVFRGRNIFRDSTVDGVKYIYKVRAISPEDYADSDESNIGHSLPQWFHKKRINALLLLVIISGLAFYLINKAKKGGELFIRKIAGLEAVDDAVGRATEMGRPILYLTGLLDMSDISTLASLSILSRVAKRAAFHNTPVIVPCYDPIVMSAAQEVVKQAHSEVGRPDTYDERRIFFLTSSQFGYAAGVDGIIMREKPGAIFLQGYFFAESLILAETGNSVGAIQIAGTPAVTQLPFFIASCDYTLIGEEMYAASTYLSREPVMLGSIKGEDIIKIILLVLMGIGVLFSTLSFFGLLPKIANAFINFFSIE